MPAKIKPPRLWQSKTGSWYVLYHENGRGQRTSLRTDDIQKAEARFQGWLKDRRLFFDVVKDPTISHILDIWMDQWVRGRMITQNRYPSIVKNLKQYFGNMHISEVTREHSSRYYELRKEGIIGTTRASDSTVRLELQRLRAAFRFMVERVEPTAQRLSSEVIPYVELPRASPPRNRVLSEDEVQLLRDTCSNLVLNGRGRARSNRMARIGRFVMLALETAQRKTAICELKWDQVDFDRNWIRFNPEGRLQTQKRRPTVPISPILRPVLERAYDERINHYVLDHDRGIYEQ